MLHMIGRLYNLEIRIGAMENFALSAGKPEGMTLDEARVHFEATRQKMEDHYNEWTTLLDDQKTDD